eukprot:3886643-Amphidinium_carterae.1
MVVNIQGLSNHLFGYGVGVLLCNPDMFDGKVVLWVAHLQALALARQFHCHVHLRSRLVCLPPEIEQL